MKAKANDEHRSEAELERLVLLEFGRLQRQQPDMIISKVEVGVGYRGALLGAMQKALAPFGSDVLRTAISTMKMHYIAYGEPGFPDLAIVAGGNFIGTELKTNIGALSPVQIEWHAAARRRGVQVTVLRDPAELASVIDRGRRGEL